MRGSTCIYVWIADTESDLTEIVNRVQKATHEAVIRVEVQNRIKGHVCNVSYIYYNREETCNVVLPLQQNFWITTTGSQVLQRQRKTAKKQQVQIGKRATLHVHHAFLYISQPLLHDCARFMELVRITQKLSFSFSKVRYGPFGFNPENFAII